MESFLSWYGKCLIGRKGAINARTTQCHSFTNKAQNVGLIYFQFLNYTTHLMHYTQTEMVKGHTAIIRRVNEKRKKKGKMRGENIKKGKTERSISVNLARISALDEVGSGRKFLAYLGRKFRVFIIFVPFIFSDFHDCIESNIKN
jgi:hypothetical protein